MSHSHRQTILGQLLPVNMVGWMGQSIICTQYGQCKPSASVFLLNHQTTRVLKTKVICACCCLSPTRTVTPSAASTVTLLPFTPIWSSLSKTFNHNSTNTACLWQEGFSLLKEFLQGRNLNVWAKSNTAVDVFPSIIPFSQPHVYGDKQRRLEPIRRENLIMSLV